MFDAPPFHIVRVKIFEKIAAFRNFFANQKSQTKEIGE